MKALLQTIFISILLGLFSAPLFAGESDCDVLSEPGVTSGLFGICNAYCEAKDCDEYADGNDPKSCTRLLENYERIRVDANNPLDSEMPCEVEVVETECPCWTAESERFVDPGMGMDAFGCFDNFATIGTVAVYGTSGNTVSYEHYEGGNVCRYMNDMTNELEELPMTPEESAVCYADVFGLIDGDFGGLQNCVPNGGG